MPRGKPDRCALRMATWNTNGYPDSRFVRLPEPDVLFMQEGGDSRRNLPHYKQIAHGDTEAQRSSKITPRLFARDNLVASLVVGEQEGIAGDYRYFVRENPMPAAGGASFRFPAVSLIRLPANNPRAQAVFAVISWHAKAWDSAPSNTDLINWVKKLLGNAKMNLAGVIIGGDFNCNLGKNGENIHRISGEMDNPNSTPDIMRGLNILVNGRKGWASARKNFDLICYLTHTKMTTQSPRKMVAEQSQQNTATLNGPNLDYFVIMLNAAQAKLDVAGTSIQRIEPSKGSDHWGVELNLSLDIS